MSFKIKLYILLCLSFFLKNLEASDFSSFVPETIRFVPRLEYTFYSSQEILPSQELVEEFLKQKEVIVRIQPEDKENREIRDNADEILSQLVQKGFEPALEFGLGRSSTLEKRAFFMVNALENQLTTVASGQLGERIIKHASSEDPYFRVRDYEWYLLHYNELPRQSFIYSFIKTLEGDPENSALKKKLIYCLAMGYLHSALEVYPICHEYIEKSGSLLLSLYPHLIRLEEFPEESEQMPVVEGFFWQHATDERYGLNAYHLFSTLLTMSENPTLLMKEQLKKLRHYNNLQPLPKRCSDFYMKKNAIEEDPMEEDSMEEDVPMDEYVLYSGEFKGSYFEFK